MSNDTEAGFDHLKGMSAPARRALAAAGIERLAQLATLTEAEVLQLHGMGPKAMGVLRQALANHGWSFVDSERDRDVR